MNDRIVVYIGNANCYNMMQLSAKSLLYHSQVDQIYFLIDDIAFPAKLPDIIKCIDVHTQTFFPPSCPNINHYYSYMTLMRTTISKLIAAPRVLLLDPDTVITAPIDSIWDCDISDYYFAAVQETRNHNHTKNPYYNAGVMLLNLDKLRKDGMDDKIIAEINTKHYEHLEQDVLNFLCDDHILSLPSDYSASFVSDPTDTPKIMHFLSYSKHLFTPATKQYATLTWDDIMNRKEGEQHE